MGYNDSMLKKGMETPLSSSQPQSAADCELASAKLIHQMSNAQHEENEQHAQQAMHAQNTKCMKRANQTPHKHGAPAHATATASARSARAVRFAKTATAAALAVVTTLGGASAAFAQSNVSIFTDSVQLTNSTSGNNGGNPTAQNSNNSTDSNNSANGQQINVQERLIAPESANTISGIMSIMADSEVFESDGLIYRFLHPSNSTIATTVAFVGVAQATQGLEAIEIPETVTNNGVTYTVAAIGEEAAKAAVAELDGIAQETTVFGTGAGIEKTKPIEGALGSKIEQITFPSTIKYIDVDSLAGFDNLKTFEVSIENETYTAYDGIIYTHDLTQLIAVPSAKDTAAVIPADTTAIFAPGICYANAMPGFAVEAPESGNALEANFVTDGETLYRVVAGENVRVNNRNATNTSAAVAWRAAAAGNATVIPMDVALGDRRIPVTAIDAGSYVASVNTQLQSIISLAQITAIATADFVEIEGEQVQNNPGAFAEDTLKKATVALPAVNADATAIWPKPPASSPAQLQAKRAPQKQPIRQLLLIATGK